MQTQNKANKEKMEKNRKNANGAHKHAELFKVENFDKRRKCLN